MHSVTYKGTITCQAFARGLGTNVNKSGCSLPLGSNSLSERDFCLASYSPSHQPLVHHSPSFSITTSLFVPSPLPKIFPYFKKMLIPNASFNYSLLLSGHPQCILWFSEICQNQHYIFSDELVSSQGSKEELVIMSVPETIF